MGGKRKNRIANHVFNLENAESTNEKQIMKNNESAVNEIRRSRLIAQAALTASIAAEAATRAAHTANQASNIAQDCRSALIELRPDSLVRRPSASPGSARGDRRWAAASADRHGLAGAIRAKKYRLASEAGTEELDPL